MAILSVQNATPVALKFLGYESIKLPVGLVLAFGASVGAISGAAIAPLAFSSSSPDNGEFDNDLEEDLEEPKVSSNASNASSNDWLESESKDW